MYDTLLREFCLEEEDEYKKVSRKISTVFDYLPSLINDEMMEEDIVMRAAMPPKIKSAATICLLNALFTYFVF